MPPHEAENHHPVGSIKNYERISAAIVTAIVGCSSALVLLSSLPGHRIVSRFLGPMPEFGVQLFFWGALGAAISSSIFLARDKEENELESLQEHPDLKKLRYPTKV